MKPLDAYGDLLRMGDPIISTREAAGRLTTSLSNASHALRSMEEAGLAQRLRRGLWTLRPDLDPFAFAPYLTAPYPAYVSFWSALARHAMIEQIPRQISVASLDRTRRIQTSAGTFSVHHLGPDLFGGYEGTEAAGYIASPEKAFFDTVYVRAVRGLRVYLPELSLPSEFDESELELWVERVSTKRLRTLVSRGLIEARAQAARA